MRTDADIYRVLDHAAMTRAGRDLLARFRRDSLRPLRMRWRKERFVGKMRARVDWEYRRLVMLYRTAHRRDEAALDLLAAAREIWMQDMLRASMKALETATRTVVVGS